MKVLAMYLPQFHRVNENDQWWGEGFTEWTAVKSAKKLYEGHEQPRIPKQKKYYNLLEKDTMLWQSSLMKKYGVDGICMYHYWFKDGRRILEKPAENLLSWTDIDMPFCFCWANETWARTWSNLADSNVWANSFQQNKFDNGNGILLEQKYGMQEQWKQHFDYLYSFFRDRRYIKIDGRPLLLLYKSANIPCLVEMLEYWRELAKLYGMEELYVIGSGTDEINKSILDARMFYEPARSKGLVSPEYTKDGIAVFTYADIWGRILDTKSSEKTYFEGVVGYDDTPRRGKAGSVIEQGTPAQFAYFLTELLAKSYASRNELVFLNAWNEWGEGMYLEPDERYGYGFLEAIPYAKTHFMMRVPEYAGEAQLVNNNHAQGKDCYYLRVLDQWMTLRDSSISIDKWLIERGYHKVAIYGYGILGKHLYRELKNSEIFVSYLIDQNSSNIQINEEVYSPSDSLPETDVIIVTATYYYCEIYQMLKRKGVKEIISLETVIHECS